MNSDNMKLVIRQKTQELISAIEQLTDNENMPGDFHIDLAKDKLISLYNLLCAYQNTLHQGISVEESHSVNEPEPEEEVVQVSEPVSEIVPIEEEKVEIPVPEAYENNTDFVDLPEGFEIAEDPHHEPDEKVEAATSETLPAEENIPVQAEVQYQSNVNEKENQPETKQILSDKFQKDNNSLHQRFNTGRDDTSISSRLQSHPVPDLRKAIGINDRFSFITELFNGDKTDFESYLERICALNASAEILDFFAQSSNERNWERKPSYTKFRDLVQRFALSK